MLISLLILVVPGEPCNVKVEVVNSTAIEVSWTPPDEKERHGIIRGYQIHVQNMNRVGTNDYQKTKIGLDRRDHDAFGLHICSLKTKRNYPNFVSFYIYNIAKSKDGSSILIFLSSV